jgi:hypothetical protein
MDGVTAGEAHLLYVAVVVPKLFEKWEYVLIVVDLIVVVVDAVNHWLIVLLKAWECLHLDF